MAYYKLLFVSRGLIQGFLRACKIDDKKVFQSQLQSTPSNSNPQ